MNRTAPTAVLTAACLLASGAALAETYTVDLPPADDSGDPAVCMMRLIDPHNAVVYESDWFSPPLTDGDSVDILDPDGSVAYDVSIQGGRARNITIETDWCNDYVVHLSLCSADGTSTSTRVEVQGCGGPDGWPASSEFEGSIQVMMWGEGGVAEFMADRLELAAAAGGSRISTTFVHTRGDHYLAEVWVYDHPSWVNDITDHVPADWTVADRQSRYIELDIPRPGERLELFRGPDQLERAELSR